MTAIALASGLDRFSIVTIGTGGETPAWASRLRWPSRGDRHVPLDLDRDDRRSLWAARLDSAVLDADRQVLLVAEGVGCLAASWWARLSPAHYVSRVAGALMFEPAGEHHGRDRRTLFASPQIALPFPSVVLTEREHVPALEPLVGSWGSRLLDGGRQRTGEPRAWLNAQRLIERITAAVVAHDLERGLALRQHLEARNG